MWRAQHRDADKPFKTQVEIRDELYGAKPGGSRRAEMKPPDPSTTALALPAHARSQLLASRRRALIDKSKATQDDATTTKWGDSNKPDLSTGSWSEHIVTSLLNPTVKDTQNIRVTKKALSPVEHDLLNDRYAPRAFAHAARNMSGTFGHVTLASSGFVGLGSASSQPVPCVVPVRSLRRQPTKEQPVPCYGRAGSKEKGIGQ